MQLQSYAALRPDGDFSSLVVVWFHDELPADLLAELEAQVQSVEWGQWARDGVY